MYKYEGLVVDGDGEYFAMFKYHKRNNRIIYDKQGLLYLMNNDDNHIQKVCLHKAFIELEEQIYRMNQKERAI